MKVNRHYETRCGCLALITKHVTDKRLPFPFEGIVIPEIGTELIGRWNRRGRYQTRDNEPHHDYDIIGVNHENTNGTVGSR